MVAEIFDGEVSPADLEGKVVQIDGSLRDERQVTVRVDGEVTIHDPESL